MSSASPALLLLEALRLDREPVDEARRRALEAAASILALASCTEADPSEATTLMMLVPIRMRSPSASLVRVIFSPLTKLPFVEPRSVRKWPVGSFTISAW